MIRGTIMSKSKIIYVTISISEELRQRLFEHRKLRTDTYDTIITKSLDALDKDMIY